MLICGRLPRGELADQAAELLGQRHVRLELGRFLGATATAC